MVHYTLKASDGRILSTGSFDPDTGDPERMLIAHMGKEYGIASRHCKCDISKDELTGHHYACVIVPAKRAKAKHKDVK